MSAPAWRLLAEQLKRLALPRGRKETGLFSLEGTRSMERALRNEAPIEEVLVSERFFNSPVTREQEVIQDIQARDLPLRVAPDAILEELAGGRGLGDVFAVMRIPEPGEWHTWFRNEGRSLWVVGWNLADPGNTGAVIRSALASGASGFLAVGNTDPWHPKSVRTSMGSLFALPIRRMEDTDEWVDLCREYQVETFATVCRNGEPLPQAIPTRDRLALVMGSEAFGLPEDLSRQLDRRITIPMPSGVDSYSVNAATAVAAYALMNSGT